MNKNYFKDVLTYKLNNKLLETIIIILLILIVSAFVVPGVIQIVNNTRESVYKINEQLMVVATKNYLIDHYKDVNININHKTKISLTTLVDNNLMKELHAYGNNKLCSGYVEIERISDTEYTFFPYLKCNKYETQK